MTATAILFAVLICRIRVRVTSMGSGYASTLMFQRMITLLKLLCIVNLAIGWSLLIINSFLLADKSHLLPDFCRDLFTVIFNWGYFFMVNIVLLILNVGSENNLTLRVDVGLTTTKPDVDNYPGMNAGCNNPNGDYNNYDADNDNDNNVNSNNINNNNNYNNNNNQTSNTNNHSMNNYNSKTGHIKNNNSKSINMNNMNYKGDVRSRCIDSTSTTQDASSTITTNTD
eukprot:Awhi_evm1s9063